MLAVVELGHLDVGLAERRAPGSRATASEYTRGSASLHGLLQHRGPADALVEDAGRHLAGPEAGHADLLAELLVASSRLGFSSSKGTSTASRTRVGLSFSTVLFTAARLLDAAVVAGLGHRGGGRRLVGVAGFEPTAPRSQSGCATKLRHTPAPSASVDGYAAGYRYAGPATRGCSSMAEPQPSKLAMPVRSRSPALRSPCRSGGLSFPSARSPHLLSGVPVPDPCQMARVSRSRTRSAAPPR